MQGNIREMGGYFEFYLSDFGKFPYPETIKYYSARSAFYDLVKQKKIKKIWMPKFICDSMIEPLILLHVEILYYDLTHKFFPILPKFLGDDEYLLYVNYFGVCTSVQREILKLYPSDRVIFDHSQAFFLAPLDCFATIYSPRKFLPVAEGGLLATKENILPKYYERTFDEMVQQYQHSLVRSVSTAAEAYNVFKNNENIFSDCLPKEISVITENILQSLDYDSIKEKRLKNFEFLHEQLSDYNQLKIDCDDMESPLTYPLMMDQNAAKFLINERIYTPTYWLDSLDRVGLNSFESKLISKTTHLICDQRYSTIDMQNQVNRVKDFINEY